MPNGRDVYEAAYRAGWRPEPRLTVSEWADEHRVLGNRSGHAAVHWHTDTTPYLARSWTPWDRGRQRAGSSS